MCLSFFGVTSFSPSPLPLALPVFHAKRGSRSWRRGGEESGCDTAVVRPNRLKILSGAGVKSRTYAGILPIISNNACFLRQLQNTYRSSFIVSNLE